MMIFKAAALSLALAAAPMAFTAPAAAQAMSAHTASHVFVKKSKSIKGSFQIVQRGDQTVLVFSDDFKAKRGPDLKVFLSPNTITAANGKNAVAGSLNLGALKTTKGGQEYIIPASVDLGDFKSVLVHCEAYSVLWGGSSI